jgi:hypothetical protein
MSVRNKHRLCAYCGKTKKATVDHVPPKLLLEQPFPPNLLNVPACEGCNQSFKQDDEYTRSVLAVDFRASQNKAAQFNLAAIRRSLEKPEARAFADYLTRQSRRMNILSSTGLPMVEISTDKQRVNNTGLHIMRGLYFIETGKVVPPDASIRLESKAGLTADHPDMHTISRVFHVLPDHRHRESGTAFSYMAGFGHEGLVSVWVMLLYDYFFWVGGIDGRAPADRTFVAPDGSVVTAEDTTDPEQV